MTATTAVTPAGAAVLRRGSAGAALALRRQFPPRSVPAGWDQTYQDAGEIVHRLSGPPFGTGNKEVERKRAAGIAGMLRWLADQPGDRWQDRWLACGAEEAGGRAWRGGLLAWQQQVGDTTTEVDLQSGLLALFCGDVIRPGLGFLLTRTAPSFRAAVERSRDPEGFEHLRRTCSTLPDVSPLMQRLALHRVATIMVAKGGLVADVTVGDCVELLDVQSEVHAKGGTCKTFFYQLLHDARVFGPDAPPTIRAFRGTSGQLGPEALIDRFNLACTPIRDVFVDYLRDRQIAMDYVSLYGIASDLGKFWQDLEAHHPGIDSLRLAPEVAAAWRQRITVKTRNVVDADGNTTTVTTERTNFKAHLISIRCFYLDLAQKALEDPARYARWAAPSPVSAADIDRRKDKRRQKARMDQRTRERLPALPTLVSAAEHRRAETAALLAAAEAALPGEQFTACGRDYTRPVMPTADGNRVWGRDHDSGRRIDATTEEQTAFWAWAAIEVLRHTGVRVEEMLEVTHHSFMQYRLPSTGEVVPLLQIAPSKTDAERLLLISPELADVLSAIICRVRDASGRIPSVTAYDSHERVWLPPAPLLFQRRWGAENRAIPRNTIERALARTLAESGLTGPDGAPLTFTPHDFRRMFVTDALMAGLPPHIAQVICGHDSINTTMGYAAVYPEEAITAHRAFLARRRTLRPSEEYRTVTDAEWEEFLGHFERRKVSVGVCGRAYGTACVHEHACVRCPMLRPDPDQRPRLEEIRDNLTARIAEAEREGWLGEVEGLQVSLAGAEDKLAQLDRRASRSTAINLGMPHPAPARNQEVEGNDALGRSGRDQQRDPVRLPGAR